jgi:NADH-quinone oxidoreductase subunit H
MLIHFVTFFAKVLVMIWLQMLLRWTLPRFRYDQVMDLCWKIMLPLSLLNIFVTGAVILLVQG